MLIDRLLQPPPTAQIRNGPNVHGLGSLQRWNPRAAKQLIARMNTSQGQITGNGA